jgi:hypothetical protein
VRIEKHHAASGARVERRDVLGAILARDGDLMVSLKSTDATSELVSGGPHRDKLNKTQQSLEC